MKLIVGLGNPGTKYLTTKHNFGFWVIDQLVKKRSLKYILGKGDFIFAQENDCFFVKPTSFVNDSGLAIKNILNNYNNITISNLLIIYDDINIDLGKIKFMQRGSDGGHNGIKSIIYHLNTEIFDRLKIGIATNMQMRPSENYVLKPFHKKYAEIVDKTIINAAEGIDYCLKFGIEKTMNNYNKKDIKNGK